MASFSPSDYNAIFMFMALLSALTFFFKRKSKNSSLNLPPGPPGWPIVGNLIQFIRSGKPFMHFSRDLRSIYGPIFTIKMGARTHIVISSAELAHEALVARGQTFASRPPETLTRAVYSCDKFTVNSAVYGPVWRSLRRNMVSNMLSASRLREFRDVRQRAMDRLIDRLRDESESTQSESKTQIESTQCGAVHVLKNARFAVFCILLSMCFGVEMEESDVVNIDCLMKKVLIVLNPRLDDFLPFLSSLFTKQRKEAMQVREEQMRTLVPLIDRRRSDLNDPSPDKKCASFAYLDTLFDLQIEGRKSSPTDAEIVTLCSEFLNGGTDTTATAIEWAIARMIHDPDIQSKLYQEIVAVAGNRKVDEKDIDKMVYLNAFTKELLRKHPPTHMSLTHAVEEPTTLGGYDIPPGVNVEFYLLPISEDPTCWSDPESFDPDRFASGKEAADITGVTGIKMMPFGVGRRICPGLSMAMLHVSLMVARLVQEFEWCALPSQRTIDFTEKLEFTVVMKTSLQAVIKPRK